MGLPLFQSPSQVKGDVSISSAEKTARHDRSAIRRSAPPPRRRGGTASANSSSRDRDTFPNYFGRDLFTQEHLDIIAAEARDNARDLEALIERSDPALVPERRRETLRELARSMNWDTGSIRNADTFGRVRLRSPSQPVREEAADDNSFLVGTGLEDDDVLTTGHTQIRRAIYNWTSRGGDRRPLVSQPSLTYRTIMSGTAPQHQPSRRRFAHAARRGGSAPYPFSRMARSRANEEREARALFSHDGLGDRNRSLSPESGVWDTLLTTLTPDPQPPSVGSSFASTVASQSAGESASTSFTEPDLAFGNTPEMAVATDPGCESAGEEHDTSEEEDDDANIEVALSSGFRRHIPRSHPTHRSFPLPATSSGTDLGEMLQFVRSLAARDDLPAGFWAEAGLSRREGSG